MSSPIARRQFVTATVGAVGAASLAGCLGDDDDNDVDDDVDDNDVEYIDEEPDYGDYLDDANLYEGQTVDWTGEEDVLVMNGAGDGFAFDPPTIAIDPGTTVVWEWTGRGGSHNVASNDEYFYSGSPVDEAGHTFEHSEAFEDPDVYLYHCEPHVDVGQKGAVYVVE